mmetsp:Transcript_61402/g.171665  ORF Transcript_61402/g.171665 Transcript_61402/m.171665 type:complete len:220 (-) Transcript_61402:159-818(-)
MHTMLYNRVGSCTRCGVRLESHVHRPELVHAGHWHGEKACAVPTFTVLVDVILFDALGHSRDLGHLGSACNQLGRMGPRHQGQFAAGMQGPCAKAMVLRRRGVRPGADYDRVFNLRCGNGRRGQLHGEADRGPSHRGRYSQHLVLAASRSSARPRMRHLLGRKDARFALALEAAELWPFFPQAVLVGVVAEAMPLPIMPSGPPGGIHRRHPLRTRDRLR